MPASASAYWRRMRGLLGYLSRSSLSSGMAFANSFRARRSAPLSAIAKVLYRSLVLDPLQFEFCGCRRCGVWIFADALLERLAGHADIAGFDVREGQLEHGVRSFVLIRKVGDDALVV